jgi:glyoxylase-like metal-dependent hydrolase (beta-lactamase superfamily II)
MIFATRDRMDTAVEQVRVLRYTPDDVLHIVMTHLHFDHAGGLPDFPKAQVHVYAPEYHAAQHRRAFMERFYTGPLGPCPSGVA